MTESFYIPQRAVVIVAHADDIEFGMTGTIARWTAGGAQVTYCIVTDNSSGSNDPAMPRDTLIETRQREQRASAAAVGVHDVRFLGYPDGVLQPTLELRRELTRIIRELRPQVVMMMDPTTIISLENTYINHPDHRAAGEAALYATFPSAESRPIFPELLEEGLEPHKVAYAYMNFSLQPNLVVDIASTFEQKLAALRCHASQVDEEALNFVREYSARAGAEYGLQYAESFRVLTLNPNGA
jgi:LmbE family N-acetylglucosaminyl deacetylase